MREKSDDMEMRLTLPPGFLESLWPWLLQTEDAADTTKVERLCATLLPFAATEFLKADGDVTEFLFSFTGNWIGGDWIILECWGGDGGSGERQTSRSFSSGLSGLLLTTSRKTTPAKGWKEGKIRDFDRNVTGSLKVFGWSWFIEISQQSNKEKYFLLISPLSCWA